MGLEFTTMIAKGGANNQNIRIMTEEIKIKARDWEKLLSFTQQQKYKTAIRQGWFSDYHDNSWRHSTFYGAYIWKYPKMLKVVRMFEELIGHKPLWEDVTDANLRDLFMKIQENYAPNSAKTVCAIIKAVIRENDATKEINSPTFGRILRAKAVPVQSVYLSDEEINRIIKYNPQGRTKRYVQRMFLMECLCGARYCDCQRITEENIDDTGHFLVYVTQKTKTEVRVPLHKKLRPFLVCRTGDEPLVGEISEMTYNRTLRDICRDCGINDNTKVLKAGREETGKKFRFVSSNTGRRSFATNLSKKGVPLEQIAVMMRHTCNGRPNIQMTRRYIVGKTEIDSNTLRLFGVYDEDGDNALNDE